MPSTAPSLDASRPASRGRLALVLALLAAAAGLVAAAPADAAEPLTIAASRAPVSLPVYVAARRGFFRDEGLDVTIADCIGGTRCLGRLLDGTAQLATTSEMPVVLHAFSRPDVVVVATMVNASDNLKLVVRAGAGIAGSEQLAGRRIGVIPGTASQFQLESHLLATGIDPRRVTMVPLQPEEVVAALRAGRIDAAAVWEPYGYEALHGADPAGARLPLSGGYIETYNLVAARSWLAAHDAQLTRALRAIERAEQFIHADPAAAQAVLRGQLGLDQRVVDWVWPGLGFRLSLDQSLLSTMESETRWAQREGHVPGGARPNVLSLVHAGPLKALKPAAVGTGN